jgi:hypothetical protein
VAFTLCRCLHVASACTNVKTESTPRPSSRSPFLSLSTVSTAAKKLCTITTASFGELVCERHRTASHKNLPIASPSSPLPRLPSRCVFRPKVRAYCLIHCRRHDSTSLEIELTVAGVLRGSLFLHFLHNWLHLDIEKLVPSLGGTVRARRCRIFVVTSQPSAVHITTVGRRW